MDNNQRVDFMIPGMVYHHQRIERTSLQLASAANNFKSRFLLTYFDEKKPTLQTQFFILELSSRYQETPLFSLNNQVPGEYMHQVVTNVLTSVLGSPNISETKID